MINILILIMAALYFRRPRPPATPEQLEDKYRQQIHRCKSLKELEKIETNINYFIKTNPQTCSLKSKLQAKRKSLQRSCR